MAKEKYQKNRHVRKGPRSFPYGSYPLSGAAFLPEGKKALCAGTSRVAGSPQPRRSAELAGQTCSRGCTRKFLFLLRVLGKFRADGAPPFVRVTWSLRPYAQSDSFALAKESRESGGGFLKGGTVGDSLKWRSFVKCLHFSFLPPRAEKYITPPPIN